ncbi:TrbG/VirB9 family P-type conjugative transfer protein [Neisseria iguanae]|uniref:TrbG/VirB9 family P-type conjugative transfer protein n=1 Tax=Neisseria iguanae TaxID=90242 RepID=UPI001474F218|nr:TrbG/VirB9 family P-type conjugative transfer protein [Neisseria iguanae]
MQLEADERLEGETASLGTGDSEAWKVAVKGNNIIFKPAAASLTTNMLMTTNKKRTYAFELSLINQRIVPKPLGGNVQALIPMNFNTATHQGKFKRAANASYGGIYLYFSEFTINLHQLT